MDFNKFDTRAAMEKPAALHLCDPATGAALYADGDLDRPCRVLLLGRESRKVQHALREVRQAKVKASPAAAGIGDEELHAALASQILPMIVGFENVGRDGKPATAGDADWFLNLQLVSGREGEKSFAEQCAEFASTRANWMGNALTA